MNKAEKYHHEQEVNTPPEKLLHQKRVKKLQEVLFPEEWDFMTDSASDAKKRTAGVNPADSGYTSKVNGKRELFGISLLSENGMPQDKSSRDFCDSLVAELEAIQI